MGFDILADLWKVNTPHSRSQKTSGPKRKDKCSRGHDLTDPSNTYQYRSARLGITVYDCRRCRSIRSMNHAANLGEEELTSATEGTSAGHPGEGGCDG
jgi:hypothetical protein